MDLQGFGWQLALGTWVTVRVALAGLALGLCLGLLGAAAKLSGFRAARAIAEAYTTMVRGVPEMLLVLLAYFGATVAINSLAVRIGYEQYIDVSPFAAGMIALGLAFGAYATEVFRGAILAVPKGQIDAARAVGMARLIMFRRILLPQVWRFALPGLGNLWLVLLKDTALISVVGLDELMRKSAIAVGYTKQPFTFYFAAALIYLGLTVISMVGLQSFERHARRGVRRA